MSSYVVVIEGLATSLIGAYGSNVGRTPTWDKLASRGISLDQCFIDSIDLHTQLQSLWSGQHACCESETDPDLWDALNARQVPNCVITDCEYVAEYAERCGCDDVTYVPPPPADAPASALDHCVALQLFFAAAEALRERKEPSAGLTWIHSAGMKLPWDVPIELRNSFVDPEDPEPPEGVEPPCFEVDEQTDPDLVVGWGQVAAAQATVFDEGLALLLAANQSHQGEDFADHLLDADDSLIVIGLGGFALGEHGFIGQFEAPKSGNTSSQEYATDDRLHGELLSCAALIVPASGESDRDLGPAVRRSELLQLADLGATIQAMLGISIASDGWGQNILGLGFPDSPNRWAPAVQMAMLETESIVWGRCPAWSILIASDDWRRRCHEAEAASVSGDNIEPDGEEAPTVGTDSGTLRELGVINAERKLYVKPEDRWEVSDVADRRPDIAEELTMKLVQFRMAAKRGQRKKLAALSDELLSLMR